MSRRGIQPGEYVAGRYRMIGIIGTGGMGTVWSAHDEQTSSPVALKCLHPSVARDAQVVQRFLQEPRVTAALAHPNVVRILDFGTAEGGPGRDSFPYMAMELLEGDTLATVLQGDARLDVPTALRLLEEIARGTAVAHAAGIVHRDLKPGNIFLHRTAAGRVVVKILDFGISKVLAPSADGVLTTTGAVIGSLSFMSPEQAGGSRDVDFRCDVWALGVILFRCITGTLPIQAPSPEMFLPLLLSGHVTLNRLEDFEVTAPLRAIVERCLKKNKEERFPSAAELSVSLADAQRRYAPRGLEALLREGDRMTASTTIRAGGAPRTPAPIEPPAEAATIVVPSSEGTDHPTTRSVGVARGDVWGSRRVLLAGAVSAVALVAGFAVVSARRRAPAPSELAAIPATAVNEPPPLPNMEPSGAPVDAPPTPPPGVAPPPDVPAVRVTRPASPVKVGAARAPARAPATSLSSAASSTPSPRQRCTNLRDPTTCVTVDTR